MFVGKQLILKLCTREIYRAIVLVAVFLHFRQPKVSVESVTNTMGGVNKNE
jgi:hypothetical protein